MTNSVLKNRRLLLLGAAEAISNVGNWITMMAVFSLFVFRGDGGVAESSGVFLAGLLPLLVLSPLAGRLCDRYNQTHLMIGSNLLSGLAVSLLIVVERADLIYLCVVLESAFLAVITPARQALLPKIVAPSDLTRANGLLQQISSLVKVLGPMIGAAVVGMVGPHRAVVLDVVSFVLASGLIAVLASQMPAKDKTNEDPTQETTGNPVPKQSSWQFLRQSPTLRALFIGGFVSIIAIMGLDVLSSVYTRDVLLADEGFFGLSIGFVGLGSVLSGAYLTMRKKESRPFADLTVGLWLLALLIISRGLGVYLEPGPARILALVTSFIGGWGNGLIMVQSSTIIQTLSPTKILGRIAGLFQSTMVAGQLVSLAVTPVVVPLYLSVGAFFLVSGGALVLIGIVMAYFSAKSGSLSGTTTHNSAGYVSTEKGDM